jgi:hypothetical protein
MAISAMVQHARCVAMHHKICHCPNLRSALNGALRPQPTGRDPTALLGNGMAANIRKLNGMDLLSLSFLVSSSFLIDSERVAHPRVQRLKGIHLLSVTIQSIPVPGPRSRQRPDGGSASARPTSSGLGAVQSRSVRLGLCGRIANLRGQLRSLAVLDLFTRTAHQGHRACHPLLPALSRSDMLHPSAARCSYSKTVVSEASRISALSRTRHALPNC